MPAEGIHLSALVDTRLGADGEVARRLERHADAARLGAILVDLPYFEGFAVEMARYALGLPPRPSRWGDLMHRRAPAMVGRILVEHGRRDERVAALALGYLSHIAVDTALHPLVNRLARARASLRATTEANEHREVEKFQSVLFHERRFGVDMMGTPGLLAYIDVDLRPLDEPAVAAALDAALHKATGAAPAPSRWRAWGRGYWQYARVLATPLGRLPATPAAKERERAPLYDAVDFDAAYARAVARSRRYVHAGMAALEAGATEAEFHAAIPEGSIDDPPDGI